MTSGASDEPPMPQSTTRVSPCSCSWSRSAVISATSGLLVADRSTQPSRLADSSSAAVPQSVWSLAASRLANRSATSWWTCAANAASSR